MKRYLLLCFLTLCGSPLYAATTPPAAAIATAHPLATAAGHEILAAGGNAFDAAVAITATLAVVEPTGSGLGGGGFWLLHRAKNGYQTMLDGRERAPLAAHRDMYLDAKGDVIPGLSMDGPLAAGIPGIPAGLAHLAQHYGVLPLSKTLAPAIRHARNGFAVSESYRRMAQFRLEALRKSSAAASIFLHENNVPPVGHLLQQPDLANTLEAIAKQGAAGFYSGPVADKLINGVRRAGGIWTHKDLTSYRLLERQPVQGKYRGIRITSAAPPSSGGITLISALNILAGYDPKTLDPTLNPTGRTHLIVEALRRAYRDRAIYLGDPDHVAVPMARLTDPLYADGLRASIRPDRATPSNALPGNATLSAGSDTTHFSVLDKQGNRVAATLSINFPFGSGFVAPGTGVLLNDEMDDFSAKPGVPNIYGLVGGEANAIAPGKRPLSSMSPTFLESKHGVAILGTPGGSRIISMVLLGALDFAAGNNPSSWVSLKRFHHQFLPDVVQHEPDTFSAEQATSLTELGHTLKEVTDPYGNMQAILWDRKKNKVTAASDPRGEGMATVR